MTQVINLDPERPQQEGIDRAASIIRTGGLVAFPTETVYGLGADATNASAVEKLFDAKGRPADNPLIVHVSGRQMLDCVANNITGTAERLIEAFWPGPLTLVLERKPEVARSVSAGLSTVAARMPSNAIALALIRSSQTPIAAPSANRSGNPSPTSAADVLEDLDGRIDMILDGGRCTIGIESTVLDVTIDPPMILRQGSVTAEMLSDVIGAVSQSKSGDELRRSPGTRHRHYSPRARVLLIEGKSQTFLERVCKEHLEQGVVGFIGHTRVNVDHPNFKAFHLEGSREYARSIYSAFRQLDRERAGVIVVEGISEAGEGAAVMDRLRRAASVDGEQRDTGAVGG